MNLLDESNNLMLSVRKPFELNKTSWQEIKSPYFVNPDPGPSFGSGRKKHEDVISLNLLDFKMQTSRLDCLFFKEPCINLAKEMLGKTLVRKLPSGELLKGIIVETESYLGIIDKASHSFMGKQTERNQAMFMTPGTAYVYSIYGMYYCFNISSLEEGSAVLIRATEPTDGINLMQDFRVKMKKKVDKSKERTTSHLKIWELCNGPSKLCQAFKIDKNSFNKVDLCSSNELWLEDGIVVECSNIISCKRIGIDSYGEEWANKPFRFYLKNSRFVSRRDKAAERVYVEEMAAK